MAKEVELKLACPAEALSRVEQHPLLQQAALYGEPDTLENAYFDTPDLALSAAKVALRTRKTRDASLQTVKCATESVGGLSSRPEWEQSFNGRFDFSAIEVEPVRAMLERHRDQLAPMFTTVFQRQTRLAEPRAGVQILVMIDRGCIVAGKAEEAISEVELELVAGEPADLINFAIALAADLPLVPFDLSKAERGYRLFENNPIRPQRAGRVAVTGKMPPLQAFLALANHGQQCWQANLHGALASSNPEFVHQFRVALRRLGALLRIFEPVLPEQFFAEWADGLKQLAAVTGEVRDLDVMRAAVLEPMLQADDSERHRELVQRAIVACGKAREKAGAAIEQLSNGVPLLAFARDVHALETGKEKKDFARFAESRLGRAHRRAVKRFDRVVRKPTSETAHRFRIGLKYLRYSCEFFSPLFDEDEMLQYAKGVSELQDEFGFINDLHVAMTRLDQWVAEDSSLKEVRDYIARWHKGKVDKKMQSALTKAGEVLRQCQPWCGECERRGIKSARKRLREGISLKLR